MPEPPPGFWGTLVGPAVGPVRGLTPVTLRLHIRHTLRCPGKLKS
jgi:hypothetical protein